MILVAESDGTVYTDQPTFPLRFADSTVRDLDATRQAFVAGMVALHHATGEPGYLICEECATAWPCRSYTLAEVAAGDGVL